MSIVQRILFRNRVTPLEKQSLDSRWWPDSDVGATLLKSEGTMSMVQGTVEYDSSWSSKDFGAQTTESFIFVKCMVIQPSEELAEVTVTISTDGNPLHMNDPVTDDALEGTMRLLDNEVFVAHLAIGAHPMVTISKSGFANIIYLIGEKS